MNKTFTGENSKKNLKTFNPDDYITVFADASYCSKTNAAGYAFWIKCSQGTFRKSLSFITNNSTEAEKRGLDDAVLYVINNINFTGKIMVLQCDNISALNRIDVNYLVKELGFKKITLKHVKGHQGLKNPRSAVNTWCDREAGIKMRELRRKLELELK